MPKYIKKNVLNLGSTKQEILENLNDVLFYIYEQCQLNHDAMKKLYSHINVPITYDHHSIIDSLQCHELKHEYGLKFVNHEDEDDKYLYQIHERTFQDSFTNRPIAIELHKYLMKKSPQNLKIDKYKWLMLENSCGMNHDIQGVRFLDWKLHFWSKYISTNDNGITLHDLIIAAFKIKSHKFENVYDVYDGVCGVNTVSNRYGLYINVDFKHD